MVLPELEECPNCGNTDIYCHSNDRDVIELDTEKYCDECQTKFDLEEAVYG